MAERPPGPSLRLLTTFRFLARPIEWTPKFFARYGDPLLLPVVNGDVVMTARPELVKQIFGQHPRGYSPFAADGVGALTGKRSVFQLRDAEHRRHRKLVMPPFHGSRMRAYAHAMQDTAREVFEQAADSGPVVLHDLTQRISLDVIIRTVFGVQEPARVRTFAQAITDLVDATSPLFIFMPFMQRELFGLGPYAKFRRKWARLDELIAAQVARSRDDADDQSILSLLLQARDEDGDRLDDEEIRDELRTLLFAGHETTAIALCWVVDAVGRDPAIAARLLEELHGLGGDADPEEIAKLPYLDAVCDEALRLYPIVTEVLRNLHEPMQLGEYHLSAGMAVSASILGVHRRDDLYPDPLRFRPERFLERKFGAHEFLPFGGGHRRCIGSAFAGFEMRIVVGTLLRELGVTLLEKEVPAAVRRNVTLAPKGGVPVELSRARAGTVRKAA